MAAPKRKKGQREIDLRDEAMLFAQGYTQQEIADKLNAGRPYSLTKQAIGRDLRILRKQWHDESMADINTVKAQQMAEIRLAMNELLRAWYRSIGEFIDETVTTGLSIRRGELKEKKTHTELRAGNVGYMNAYLRAQDQMAKLYGTYAPIVHELNWRKQLEDAGIPAGDLFEQMVEAIMEAQESE